MKQLIQKIFKTNPKKVKKEEVSCPKSWYGNTYGGFYINPELIDENSIIYSFGIGEDISFDEEIINKHSSNIFGFDPTPKSIKWIKENKPEKFIFYDFGLSNRKGQATFYLPINPEYVSGSVVQQSYVDQNRSVVVEMRTISDITSMLKHDRIDILKMDIEGTEYDVIDDLLNCNVFIGQILIEFHDRFFDNGYKKTLGAIKKLREKGYYIFAVSDSQEEVSFINKKLLTNS